MSRHCRGVRSSLLLPGTSWQCGA